MHFVVVLQQEHVFFILVPMSRNTPELCVEQIRSDDFRVSTDSVLSAQGIHEFVVDVSTVGVEEGATG